VLRLMVPFMAAGMRADGVRLAGATVPVEDALVSV
jgi:hypothetical protein